MSSRSARQTRRAWIARAIAWLLAIVFVASSVSIDPECFLVVDAAGDAGDDRTPCPCPLDCATCVVARSIPASPPTAQLVPIVPRLVGEPPPIEAEGRPMSPDPGEISHVPKSA